MSKERQIGKNMDRQVIETWTSRNLIPGADAVMQSGRSTTEPQAL